LLAVNNRGVIAGYFGSGAQGHPNKGYQLRPNGHYVNENFPGSVQTQVTGLNDHGVTGPSLTAAAINNYGDVAGFYAKGNTTDAFLRLSWGKFLTLAVPGASMTQALGINDHDEVVGVYAVGSGDNAAMHGFTWRPGYGFRTVDDPHGVGTTTINGVNDAGDLVGFYVDSAGNTDGMLARPRG
jgi:hypothetical protein